MTTEAEIEAACAAWYGGRDAWILNTSEIMKGTVRRKMRAALEAAAAVREHTLSIVSGGTVSITSFTVPMSTYQDAALANTDERLKRMLVIIAKQSSRDEGAIPDMVVNAIGEAEYDRLCDEITDDEVRGLAYPSTTERTDDA